MLRHGGIFILSVLFPFFVAFENEVLGKLLVFWFCMVSFFILFFNIPQISWILVVVTTYLMIWMVSFCLCIFVMTEESNS
ncbi:MAG: hypothetical protein PHX25_02460 [Candidatus Pacebacteria bacterium]|nr:hypothetical protein [Candidatus Paceibacterota bacterium]